MPPPPLPPPPPPSQQQFIFSSGTNPLSTTSSSSSAFLSLWTTPQSQWEPTNAIIVKCQNAVLQNWGDSEQRELKEAQEMFDEADAMLRLQEKDYFKKQSKLLDRLCNRENAIREKHLKSQWSIEWAVKVINSVNQLRNSEDGTPERDFLNALTQYMTMSEKPGS